MAAIRLQPKASQLRRVTRKSNVRKALRIDEIAEHWDVSRKTVERLIKRGGLEAFKVGTTWRIRAEDIEQFEKKIDQDVLDRTPSTHRRG